VKALNEQGRISMNQNLVKALDEQGYTSMNQNLLKHLMNKDAFQQTKV
jgi:hypothetical protein